MPTELIRQFLAEPTGHAPRAPPEVIIAEAHHRIANNLAMIAGLARLQANELTNAIGRFEPDAVRALLAEVSTRIETVARLHRLLSDSTAESVPDLATYLADVALSVINAMCLERTKPRFSAELRGCALRPGQALHAGLIVGELVTNSVKYAHPAGVVGEIRLACRSFTRSTVIEVSDDGVGYPEAFDPQTDGGLGLRLVRSLATQMNASLVFDQTDLGLSVRLEVPSDSDRCAKPA